MKVYFWRDGIKKIWHKPKIEMATKNAQYYILFVDI